MGFGHRVYKNYDPRAKIIKQVADEVFEVTGTQPAARHRPRARAHRARGRVLRQAQALPERRLLLGPHLPGDGLPGRHVPGAVRHPAHVRLARPVGGDARATRSRRSPARARSTRVSAAGIPADRRSVVPAWTSRAAGLARPAGAARLALGAGGAPSPMPQPRSTLPRPVAALLAPEERARRSTRSAWRSALRGRAHPPDARSSTPNGASSGSPGTPPRRCAGRRTPAAGSATDAGGRGGGAPRRWVAREDCRVHAAELPQARHAVLGRADARAGRRSRRRAAPISRSRSST